MYVSYDITPLDKEQIALYDRENMLLFLDDPFTLKTVVLQNEAGEAIGLGLIRPITEYKMVLNPNLSLTEKVKGLQMLMHTARIEDPCNESLIIVTQGGQHFVNILEKHFNFFKVNGIPLKLEG
jgi:hypothetical protein